MPDAIRLIARSQPGGKRIEERDEARREWNAASRALPRSNTHSLCPGCGEPNAVRVLMENIEAGTYYVFVDGFSTGSADHDTTNAGEFTLHVEVIASA